MSSRPASGQDEGLTRETPPGVRRVALVLRPERDLDKALQQIRAWAAATGVTLVGAEGDPRLPADVARRPDVSLAAAANWFSRSVGTARCSGRSGGRAARCPGLGGQP